MWEGGSLRTIYSSGVSDGLLEAGISFDYAVGVSAGIAYGVSFLSGQFGRNLTILERFANDKRYMGRRNFLKKDNRCYFGRDFVYREIPDRLVPFDKAAYKAWPGTAEAVVTDVHTGRPVYFPVDVDEPGNPLLQATCAMPLVFPMMHYRGVDCLDGGVADPIPYQRALDQGCGRLVVILTRERSYVRQPESAQKLIELRYRKYPAFCAAMRARAEAYNACRQRLFQLEQAGRVLLFAPDSTEGFSRVEKDLGKIRALWQNGYDQAKARGMEVRAFLAGE